MTVTEAADKKGTLIKDLKKILPIWGGILLLMIIGVVFLKLMSLRIVNYLEYPEVKLSQIARSYMMEGEKYWLRCTEKIEKLRKQGQASILDKEDKDYKKALELFEKSLSYTEIPQIWTYLSDLALLVDDRVYLNYYQGMSIIAEKKQTTLALDYFKEALKVKKDFLPAIEKLAILNLGRNSPKDAEIYISDYQKYAPDSGRALYLSGRLNIYYQKIDEAIGLLKSSIEKDPKYLNAYSDLAECYEAKNSLADACGILKKATEVSPNHPTYLHRLGLCYMKAGKYDEARDAIKKALDLIPNHPGLCFDLAKTYEKLGKKYYASYYLKKALDLDPSLQSKMLK